ncbi:MAG: ABC transporter permease, partial [Gammaproteobacteria bacterium]|nr:ABC transporter permease [Gammaproteobacteria bacterium]
MLQQIFAVTSLNLRSLQGRLAPTLVVIAGIGGVVAVLLGLLAMSSGFRTALVNTAQPDRALVLRGSSNNEMDGWINPEELAVLETLAGFSVVSGEVYVTINASKRNGGTTADVVGRGVTPAAFELRPEVDIVVGRAFSPGKNEVIVGIKAAGLYAGLTVGDTVDARGSVWQVVGHFAAAGTAVESEIWMDLAIAQDVFRRTFSVARVKLNDAGDFDRLSKVVSADPRLDTVLVSEDEFYAEQSAAHAALIDTFAYLIAGIMALGAVVAALNTMYSTVSRR